MRSNVTTGGTLLVALLLGILGPAPARPGSLAVSAGAATVGAYGLQVTVGDTCASPDNRAVAPPPAQIEGDFEACLSLSAENVEITGTGVTFRAGDVIEIGNGFVVPAGMSFSAVLDPFLANDFASVDDPSPIAENAYHATFYLRADDLALTNGDEIQHFVGYSPSGQSEFLLTLRNDLSSQRSLHLAARQDGGGLVQMVAGQELPLAAGWNKIDLDWTAAAGSGTFVVAINDGPLQGLTGLTNSGALVEAVRWGAVGGSISTTTGTIELDGFDSWR